MLVKLTPNIENIKVRYETLKDVAQKSGVELKVSLEGFIEYHTPVDNEVGFYHNNIDCAYPKTILMDVYEEFTRFVSTDECFDSIKGKPMYGTADTLDQIKEYFKEEIADPNHKWIILVDAIKWNPENKGIKGGYRPHKSGMYIGTYKQIEENEYYHDCEFDDGYQGYLIQFHIIPVV